MTFDVRTDEVTQSDYGIPIRNIWLLLFYASDLFRAIGEFRGGSEKQPDELPDLVAEILCHSVEQRLRRNLSQGYVDQEQIRTRVRGQVDILRSERLGLFQRGQVSCRYQELTMDTPRNRFVKSALLHLAGLAGTRDLRQRCRMIAFRLEQRGVVGRAPSRRMISTERLGRHDFEDRPMLAAAKLAFDLRIPTEQGSTEVQIDFQRSEHWLRELFERAIGGFYRVALSDTGWSVKKGAQHTWPVYDQSEGASRILPLMVTDIELNHPESARRIIIDTKFTGILSDNQYGQEKLKSDYLYQIYAYLRTQENLEDPASLTSEGILLHPSKGITVNEDFSVQGHRIRFATVNLANNPITIRDELLRIIHRF